MFFFFFFARFKRGPGSNFHQSMSRSIGGRSFVWTLIPTGCVYKCRPSQFWMAYRIKVDITCRSFSYSISYLFNFFLLFLLLVFFFYISFFSSDVFRVLSTAMIPTVAKIYVWITSHFLSIMWKTLTTHAFIFTRNKLHW